MYIELNYTLNKLKLGTAVSAFTTRHKFVYMYIYMHTQTYNKGQFFIIVSYIR